MKRFLAFLFAMLMLATNAIADDYTLTEGIYVIGKDIKPGTYELDINLFGLCNLLNPDGSFKEDLYKYDIYTLEDGYRLQIALHPAKLKSLSISTEQAESKHYKNLFDVRLAAEALNYEGVDALRYALPSGTYTVGKDIPEGSWQVRYFSISDCTFLVKHRGKTTSVIITSPKSSSYDPTRSVTTAYFPLYEGDVVTVGQSMGGLFLIPFSRDLNEW